MRIIAGTRRGMVLFSPKGRTSRPITDRIKESLFNVLFNYGLPDGVCVADLFCGVGSLGLEALSRGAESVVFVERDPDIVAILDTNIKKAGFDEESKIVQADAFKIGAPLEKGTENRKLKTESCGYGLVFVDPPYIDSADVGEASPFGRMLNLLESQVSEGGVVVVRTHKDTTPLDCYGQLKTIDRRRWGTMNISLFVVHGS